MRAEALSLLLIFAPAGAVSAQGFGQNHVVLKDFEWKVTSTEHFDIHYYEGSAGLVPQAAEILERSYRKISKGLDASFTQRRPFFLYGSVNEFQQSNIVQVGDGTGGVTEAFKDRFMIYNDGSLAWLDAVTTHELVHVFQYHVLVSGFWKSARILKTVVYPLWMMEGMAEHFTAGLDDTTEDMYVRDAATSGGLIPLWKLEHFSHLKPHQTTLAYKSGATVMEFIATQYGKEKIGRMLALFESRFESSSVLQEIVGLDIFAFDKRWREYLEEKYRHSARTERLKEPTAFGVNITTAAGHIPEFNTSQVFSPDGNTLYYFSTRNGHPPILMQKDLKGKKRKTKKLVQDAYTDIENIPLGNFTNISRVLAISPDGRWLAFGAQKNHAQPLFFYDLKERELIRRDLPGFMTVQQPAFSPDGRYVAFSGMKEGFTDIYMLDRESGQVRQLTSDPQDDQSPNFAPDGKSVVFSSELHIPGDEMPYQRRLYRLDLADGSLRMLTNLKGYARDPFHSKDGKTLLFTLEGGGFSDVYELDTSSGRVERLTRTIGGSFTPCYDPEGDIVFASFRRNSITAYRGRRANFLREPVASAYPDPAQKDAKPRRKFEEKEFTTVPIAYGTPPPQKLGLPKDLEPRIERSTSAVSVENLPGLGGIEVATKPAVAVSTGPLFLSPPRPYRFRASTDLFLPAFFYSSQGGVFWTSYWQGSDMLGNHQASNFVAYNSGQGYLSYQTQYAYSRFRPQFQFGAFGLHQQDAVDLQNGLETDQRIHTQFVRTSYPLDRYHRVEGLAAAVNDNLAYPNLPQSSRIKDTRLLGASVVRDTVGGRYLVATRGSRLRLSYLDTVEVLGGNTKYYSFVGEGHKFFPLGDMSTFATRLELAGSWGRDPEQYRLGGLGGVRGFSRSYHENVANRAAFASAEYRFPMLRNLDYYMWYIFPDFYFKAIFGTVFTDAGYTWKTERQGETVQWNDIRHSVGGGLRIHTFVLQLFPLVIHFDYAQRTTDGGHVFYVYLGPLF